MPYKPESTEFIRGSFSDRLQTLISPDQPWGEYTENDQSPFISRSVTWAKRPNRYWLEQLGTTETNLFRHNRVRHALFLVSSLSVTRELDGKRELNQWYVMQQNRRSEEVYMINHLVGTPEEEMASQSMANTFDFIMDNNLYVPNGEDLARLDNVIKLVEYNEVNIDRLGTRRPRAS